MSRAFRDKALIRILIFEKVSDPAHPSTDAVTHIGASSQTGYLRLSLKLETVNPLSFGDDVAMHSVL